MKKHLFLLLCMLFPMLLMAQTRKIEGTVFDEESQPLPGVAIVAKGTTNATMSNVDGEFSLAVNEDDKIIVASFIGYKPQEINVVGKSMFEIKLDPDVIVLNEVVAVGYEIKKKENLLGAVENVSMKELGNRPLTTASMALQGQVAGVDIIQNSGQPGDDAGSIRIRGVSSHEGGNEPLVLIDGIEGQINDVNPKDIVSISVLKDASSAAIYGNKAASGVILITTKSGEESALKVAYNYTLGIQEATKLPKPIDVFTWLDLRQEMFIFNGQKAQADALETTIEEFRSGQKKSTNYYDEFFSTAPQHDHHLSFSGGNKNMKAAASLGYLKQDGVLKETNYEKFNFRTSIDGKTNDNKLSFKLNLSAHRAKQNEYTSASNYVINNINRAGPTSIYRAENGLYGFYGMHYAQKELGGGKKNTNDVMSGRAALTWNIIKGLDLTGAYNIYYYGNDANIFAPPLETASDLYGDTTSKQQSYYQETRAKTLTTTLEAFARYNRTFNEIHNLSGLAGVSRMERTYDYNLARRENYTTFLPSLTAGDPSTQSNDSRANKNRTGSYFGRLGYTLMNRYMAEINFRADGSSRFYQDKWGYFPSVSAGWRISEEDFFAGLSSTINNLKIRASWGRLGNENIGHYYTGLDELALDKSAVIGNSIIQGEGISTLGNRFTTWETSEQINIGLDLGILHDFSLTLDVFSKKTEDILVKKPVRPSLGIDNDPYQNIGRVDNKGIEVGLRYNKQITNDLSLNLAATISHIKNEIIDFGGQEIKEDVLWSIEGQPYQSFFGYKQEGIFQVDDFTWQNNSDPSIPIYDRTYKLKPGVQTQAEGPKPGDLKFMDISGPDGTPDGVINEYDKVKIGKQFPDFTYSFNIGATYRDFDLNMFFYGVQGRDLYNQGAMVVPFVNDQGNIWEGMVGERWTYDNPGNKHPRLFSDNARLTTRSDYYLEDASFLRLKNIELGYTLPHKISQKAKISRLRIFAGVQNAFTITSFKGWDPERPAANLSSDVYPQVRIYNMGINLDF